MNIYFENTGEEKVEATLYKTHFIGKDNFIKRFYILLGEKLTKNYDVSSGKYYLNLDTQGSVIKGYLKITEAK